MAENKIDEPVRSDELDDDGFYKVPRTFLEMEAARRQGLQQLADFGLEDKTLTCDECACFAVCPWAFDLYNTDGDCLAEK